MSGKFTMPFVQPLIANSSFGAQATEDLFSQNNKPNDMIITIWTEQLFVSFWWTCTKIINNYSLTNPARNMSYQIFRSKEKIIRKDVGRFLLLKATVSVQTFMSFGRQSNREFLTFFNTTLSRSLSPNLFFEFKRNTKLPAQDDPWNGTLSVEQKKRAVCIFKRH